MRSVGEVTEPQGGDACVALAVRMRVETSSSDHPGLKALPTGAAGHVVRWGRSRVEVELDRGDSVLVPVELLRTSDGATLRIETRMVRPMSYEGRLAHKVSRELGKTEPRATWRRGRRDNGEGSYDVCGYEAVGWMNGRVRVFYRSDAAEAAADAQTRNTRRREALARYASSLSARFIVSACAECVCVRETTKG